MRTVDQTHLTDEQYREILLELKGMIAQEGEMWVEDDTTMGAKNTYSNVGMCNQEELCTNSDRALFPEDFRLRNRRVLKYSQRHHLCPFDRRVAQVQQGGRCNLFNGCYYTCRLAKGPKSSQQEAFNIIEWLLTHVEELSSRRSR